MNKLITKQTFILTRYLQSNFLSLAFSITSPACFLKKTKTCPSKSNLKYIQSFDLENVIRLLFKGKDTDCGLMRIKLPPSMLCTNENQFRSKSDIIHV